MQQRLLGRDDDRPAGSLQLNAVLCAPLKSPGRDDDDRPADSVQVRDDL